MLKYFILNTCLFNELYAYGLWPWSNVIVCSYGTFPSPFQSFGNSVYGRTSVGVTASLTILMMFKS